MKTTATELPPAYEWDQTERRTPIATLEDFYAQIMEVVLTRHNYNRYKQYFAKADGTYVYSRWQVENYTSPPRIYLYVLPDGKMVAFSLSVWQLYEGEIFTPWTRGYSRSFVLRDNVIWRREIVSFTPSRLAGTTHEN